MKVNLYGYNNLKIKIMLIETENLISISNYALKIKKSRAWVDRLIRDGKITCIKVDCFKFIVLKKKNK